MDSQLCQMLTCLREELSLIRQALLREFGQAGQANPHQTDGKEVARYFNVDADGVLETIAGQEVATKQESIDLTRGLGKAATRGYIANMAILDDGAASEGVVVVYLYRSKEDLQQDHPTGAPLELSAGMIHGITSDYTYAKIGNKYNASRVMFYVQ